MTALPVWQVVLIAIAATIPLGVFIGWCATRAARPTPPPPRPAGGHGLPNSPRMQERPRTPGDLHWGDELPAATVTALHNEAREITRLGALTDTPNPEAQATCPSSQEVTAQENA